MSASLLNVITPCILLLLVVYCIKTGKLTLPAGITAWIVGMLVYLGTGYPGLLLLGTFFGLATIATAHRKTEKAALDPDGHHPQSRTSAQVLANGGTAAAMALLALLHNSFEKDYNMMMAASLAAATADTLSSELGVIYGRKHYNILTFKKEQPGPDGVVSLEGTLIGLLGAAIIALVYAITIKADTRVICIFLAGALGNLADSILGASLERRHIIGNNTVNFLNTFLAAILALALHQL